MNLVDTSGWLEYFTRGPNAEVFGQSIEKTNDLIVPTICIYEVFKKILQHSTEQRAIDVTSIMQLGHVIPLAGILPSQAAKVSHELNLPMADSIILATARMYHATLWTQDIDFQGMPNVKFIPK